MIEFTCAQCGKRLKVKDDAAGKRGKCPQCSVMLQVPDVHSQPPLAPPPRSLKTIEESLPASGTNAPIPQLRPLKRQRAAVVAADQSAEQYDQPTKIAMGAGGLGLLILALSPLFKWINILGGGVTGIRGDAKIVLAVTVLSIILFALPIFDRKRLTAVSLIAGAWGTVALFWMGGLIWRVSSILESPDVEDKLFIGILATQITHGFGLYLGLIGGLIAAGALGFLAFRRLKQRGRLWFFYISQACTLALGLLVAVTSAPIINRHSHVQLLRHPAGYLVSRKRR